MTKKPKPFEIKPDLKNQSLMASFCNKFLKSAFKTASRSFEPPLSGRSTSRRVSSILTRSRAQLGGVQSLLPLHSAVAVARLNSCLSSSSTNCRSLSQGSLCRTSPGL